MSPSLPEPHAGARWGEWRRRAPPTPEERANLFNEAGRLPGRWRRYAQARQKNRTVVATPKAMTKRRRSGPGTRRARRAPT